MSGASCNVRRCAAVWLSKQDGLSYKFRRSLIKKIDPSMLADYAFETRFFSHASGLKFSGNIINYIDRLIYFCGAHEKYMLCFLRDYAAVLRGQVSHSLTFLDVGANAGNHALFMAKQVERVLAFEPFAKVREQMERNLALNGISNVTVFPFGLSDQAQVLPFYAAGASNLGASSFVAQHGRDNQLIGELKLEVGDAVLAGQDIGSVDIVKIDVEGFERPVLEGMKKTLSKHRPLMVVEFTQTTRNSVPDEETFLRLFPEEYSFFYFVRGNVNSGRYALAPYTYGMTPKIEDVIACPNERLELLQVIE